MSRAKAQFRIISLCFALGLVFFAGQGDAHGVRGMADTRKTICITAIYDDGEPMSYTAVEINAPASQLPFQSGRSDRNGVFCFRPDSPGDWQVNIRDEMGHLVHLQAVVTEDMDLDQVAHNYNGPAMGKVNGIVTGIAVLFGMAGCLAWWQSRNRKSKTA